MLESMHVPGSLKRSAALEAVQCATQLDRLIVVDLNGKSATRDQNMFGVNPRCVNNRGMWGEAGVVQTGRDSKTD